MPAAQRDNFELEATGVAPTLPPSNKKEQLKQDHVYGPSQRITISYNIDDDNDNNINKDGGIVRRHMMIKKKAIIRAMPVPVTTKHIPLYCSLHTKDNSRHECFPWGRLDQCSL